MNDLYAEPVWHRAMLSNLANLFNSAPLAGTGSVWDWRVLATGFLDRRLYESRVIDAALSFDELQRRSLINTKARAASVADFSRKIRE
jgi:hypothetical protein